MYTRKLVVCHDENGFFIGVLEQDSSPHSMIGIDGWITPMDAVTVDPRSDTEWFSFIEEYDGISYDRFTEEDGVYYIN